MKLQNIFLNLSLLTVAAYASAEERKYKDQTPQQLFTNLQEAEDSLGYSALQLARFPSSSTWAKDVRSDSQWVKNVNEEINLRKMSTEQIEKARKEAQAKFEKDFGSNPLVDYEDAEFNEKKNEVANKPDFTGQYGAIAEKYYNKLAKQVAEAEKKRAANKVAQDAKDKAAQEARMARNKAIIDAKGVNAKNAPTLVHKFQKRQEEYKAGKSSIKIEPMAIIDNFNDSIIELEVLGREARKKMFNNATTIFMYIILNGSAKASDNKKMNEELGKILSLNGFDENEIKVAKEQAEEDARAAKKDPKIMKK